MLPGIRPFRACGLDVRRPSSSMGLSSKSHPYKWKWGHAARCACCVKFAPAGSTGWVEIHVEGEAASYSSKQSLQAIGQVTAQMFDVITDCRNLKPPQVPLVHRTCAEAAAAAHAAGQLQPMPHLCSTPTQAVAQLGPAHAPCPHHLLDQPPLHQSQSQLQGSSQHHLALPALLHLPGLSILNRPATNPVTSPAEEQQAIMTSRACPQACPSNSRAGPPQDTASTRTVAPSAVTQPDSKVMLQSSTLQDAELQLGRLEFALQHIMQP
ncbi:hypothetical protein HaLaN_24773, partial [Haematococcus lacustris]